ncbi:MAG TPA: TIGR02449 family protein [Gammaproteobacteria bacterium]|nr:TIGR02449 family protein [Gammaproteobacteria bacterium]
MGTETPIQMGELELKRLESRVEEMIQACERIKEENNFLRKQQAALVTERASLIEKTEQAHTRVELIIQRLKALEQET